MTSYRHRLRLLAQRFGYDVLRYPQSDPMWRVARLLLASEVDLVLDVGANDGGFARAIRRHGYRGQIVSYEPLAVPFERLSRAAATDPVWECHRVALSDSSGMVTINVAGNDEASSSVLPMMDAHVRAAPASAYVGTEHVEARRLDDVVQQVFDETGARNVYLKIDVQGYEGAVLAGAVQLLESSSLTGLQMELSLVDLYVGGLRWQEGFSLASRYGLQPRAVMPGFSDPGTGQTLQFDVVFLRTTGVA